MAAATAALLERLRRMRSRAIWSVQKLLLRIRGQATRSTSATPPGPFQRSDSALIRPPFAEYCSQTPRDARRSLGSESLRGFFFAQGLAQGALGHGVVSQDEVRA